MSVMDHEEERRFRLGLLLAGGGARVRRLTAGLAPGAELVAGLADAGAASALIDTASRLADDEARKVIARAESAGWQWMVPPDREYPPLLGATADPPLGLFVRGRLGGAATVALVGSRKATPYGQQVARLLGEELGRAGVVVVSGMARGVDAAAHTGALDSGGRSWAVWGTGPDRIYPPEHADLAEALSRQGALITEYPPGTPPRRHHFPERNRILAGIAQAVVVVEAAARSGALITARLAMEEGREVLAVPGNIFSEVSVGPNTLLRVGARPLLTPRDLFEAIGHEPGPAKEETEEDDLMRWVGSGEAVSLDQIAARSGKKIADVAGRVLELELSGDLERCADGRYARVRVSTPNTPESGRD
jgi:DNA processing protein